MARSGGVVGRDQELAFIQTFIDSSASWPRTLVLHGDPGIGKTTLWREGVERARGRGYRVLTAAPAEAERPLSFAGLYDLLRDVLEDVTARLPSPQRHALRVALLLEESTANPPDSRAIALACFGALRTLAVEAPVLVAIDDAQWLDAPTRGVLDFSARRLREERVAFLLTSRHGATRDRLDHFLPSSTDRVSDLEIGALSIGALHLLLRNELGRTFRRPVLRRISDTSGGNPLYAVELARGAIGDELPLPRSLAELVRGRIEALPAGTVRLLVIASALSAPVLTLLERAMGSGSLNDLLGPALRAGVIEVKDDRVVFTHPLLASGVYQAALPAHRRAIHHELAQIAPTLEERARHLALATVAADPEAAASLEAAARAAIGRGAPEAAAELAEHARRLTPSSDGESARRRDLLAAQSFWAAGDYDRGRGILESLIAATPPGAGRAEAFLRLGMSPRSVEESRDLCQRALEDAGDDRRLRSRILRHLALVDYQLGDLPRALSRADGAATDAGVAFDDEGALMSSAIAAWLRGVGGEPFDLSVLRRAADLAKAPDGAAEGHLALHLYLLALAYSDALEESACEAERLLTTPHEPDCLADANLHTVLALARFRAGQWERAATSADHAIELLVEYGVERIEAEARALKLTIEIGLGRTDAARAAVDDIRRVADQANDAIGAIRWRLALGTLELSLGDDPAAADELAAALALMRNAGISNPSVLPAAALAVQAFAAAGDLPRAEAATRDLEEVAARLGTPRALAAAHRSRGLVFAARNDLDAALRSFNDAIRHHDLFADPFERGLTLMALGRTQRRARHRGAARESLQAAAIVFEGLPAPLWSAKARAELARIGGRPPSDGRLTPAERRVAQLVAAGRSNKEVAAALYLSVKTVEANLSSTYAKLGVRSRAGLGARLESKP